MHPWSKKKSTTSKNNINSNDDDGMTADAATSATATGPQASTPVSSTSGTRTSAAGTSNAAAASSPTSGLTSTATTAGYRLLTPLELVERRLKSTWGRRPIHPASGDGEPSNNSTMHELIAKIGTGANAGTILWSPSSTIIDTSTTASIFEDAVEETSPSSSPPLLSSPTQAAWKEIEERCQTHPHEASHLDRRGRTCLHAACAKKPPLSVIQALLQALNTNSIILQQRDKHGRTPLLIAIAHNADLSVILWLLQTCPKAAAVSDHSGNLPLMLACCQGGYHPPPPPLQSYSTAAGGDGSGGGGDGNNFVVVQQAQQVQLLVQHLLLSFPQAAQRESFNGRLALHMAVEGQAPAAVVAQLVQVYPQAVLHDGCGLNPLFLAIRFHASVHVIATLVQACPQATLTRDRGQGMPLRRALENQSPVAVQALLCTCPQVVLDADQHVHNTALHAALECGTSVKVATLQLLLRMAPQLASQRSRSGHTPLTLACKRWQGFRESLQRHQEQHQALLVEQQQQEQRRQEQANNQQDENNNVMGMDFVAQDGAGLLGQLPPQPLPPPPNNNNRRALHLWSIHVLEGHCRQMWQLIVPLMQAAFYGAIDNDTALLAAALGISSLNLNNNNNDSTTQQHPPPPQQQQQAQNHVSDDNANVNSNQAPTEAEATLSPQQPQQQQQQPPPQPQPPQQEQPMRLHVLHAAVSLNLPLDVVVHALEVHASDATTRNDPSGRYPLQLCILSQPTSQPQRHCNDKDLLLEKEQCILKTLQAYPEATELPDVTGRLALHLAAQESTSVSIVVLQELWTHYPVALARLDPLWRLYPFQIAAAGAGAGAAGTAASRVANERAREWQQTHDLQQLSAIFVLLKQRPDLLHLHL